ncbi:pentapeptide repeat-containing protein [Sorangium sp. So ce385]|uniref:WD40 domain-containing protein n=1 Tax=Sorangium sp. So ce385 TaxID=3133308 RepID=UPI003F5B6EC5
MTRSSAVHPDVLIVTALQEELEAVLAAGAAARDEPWPSGGLAGQGAGPRAAWEERRDRPGFRYHVARIPNERGETLVVAAAWIGEMGGTAAAARVQQLLDDLKPETLAMCGICAGDRREVSLGDVIVADRVYIYDHGKLVAGAASERFWQDITTYNLEATWRHDAAFFAREFALGAAPLQRDRPVPKAAQRRWLLRALDAHERRGGPAPLDHPERQARCPRWSEIVQELEQGDLNPRGLIRLDEARGAYTLTDAGRAWVVRDRNVHPDEAPAVEPFRVHVGPIATGHSVQEHPGLFDRLRRAVRRTLGVEMEAAALGLVAEREGLRSIIAKAVSDHADHEKDDSFREFACRASAELLLAFLRRQLRPRPQPVKAREDDDASSVHRAPVDRRERPRGELVGRVERVCRLREEGASIVELQPPAPLAGLLEVSRPKEGSPWRFPLGIADKPLDDKALEIFGGILHAYRAENPWVQGRLVHVGERAPEALAHAARARGIELTSLGEYQRLLDLSRYAERQLARVDADERYPSALYVEQHAKHRLGRAPWEATEDVLQQILSVLDSEHGRLLLVLGDFGTGKTFLMRELCRRLTAAGGRTPVLVEMRALEKRRSLNELLAQHFAAAGLGKIDLDGFRYLLAEGRVILLFDGFDELAFRVSYDRVLEHFGTVLEAASERAKVVVTSRTGHFLTDREANKELTTRAEQTGHARLFKLEPFGERQIQRFLVKLLGKEDEARARFELLRHVEDLLGLSANPRMLSFIAEIDEQELTDARAQAGRITSAALYELLLRRWLLGEVKLATDTAEDPALSEAQLWKAVTDLALMLWPKVERGVGIEEIPRELIAAAQALDPKRKPAEEGQVRHQLGSRSLLVRDEAGSFSFLHQSVMEWLVADAAAVEVKASGDAPVLGQREMSDLMADFFIARAGHEAAARWAAGKLRAPGHEVSGKNALRVEQRLHVERRLRSEAPRDEVSQVDAVWDFEDEDLRGQDFSEQDLHEVNFRRANLSGATLVRADLRGARLGGATLRRADLRGAVLAGADLTGADLSWARLTDADLTGATLTGARLLGAKLIGAKLPPLAEREAGGAARTVEGVAPMWMLSAGVLAVAFSPDGDLLASGHTDGTVWLWDAGTGAALRVLRGHTREINSLAWSPDGQTLASGSDDRTVRLWRSTAGEVARVLPSPGGAVLSVTFGPDGSAIAAGLLHGVVAVFPLLDTTAEPLLLRGHAGAVRSVAFGPDGHLLASGSDDATVRLWSARDATELHVLKGHKNRVRSVAWSASGILASGSDDRTVRLWQVNVGSHVGGDLLWSTCAPLAVLEGHDAGVRSLAWSAGGILASGSADSSVQLWQGNTGKALGVFEGHYRCVRGVAWSPDGTIVASGSDDRTIRLWQGSVGRTLRVLKGHDRGFRGVAWSADGMLVASASDDETVRLWQGRTGKEVTVLKGHAGRVNTVAWSPDGVTLASGSDDHSVRLWQGKTGKELGALGGHTGRVWSVAWSPDGVTLASGADDLTVRLWSASTGRPLGVLRGHTAGVGGVAWSANGVIVASGSDDHTVRLWHSRTCEEIDVLMGHTAPVNSVAWSPDGVTVASSSDDYTVRLWQGSTGKTLGVLRGHTAAVNSVAWSADGAVVASSSDDHTVRLWQGSTGQLLGALHGHVRRVWGVAFHPDSRTLASASDDGTVRFWDVGTQRCLAIFLVLAEGWVAFTPDGRYKFGGNLAGSFWHAIHLCRFEPGELDPHVPGLRLSDDELLLRAAPRIPRPRANRTPPP